MGDDLLQLKQKPHSSSSLYENASEELHLGHGA
jgi:hypothetical protein